MTWLGVILKEVQIKTIQIDKTTMDMLKVHIVPVWGTGTGAQFAACLTSGTMGWTSVDNEIKTYPTKE